jgi:hypothetical protein
MSNQLKFTRECWPNIVHHVEKTQFYKLVQKFKNEVQTVEDFRQSGQALQVIMPEMIAAVDDLTRENCCITISEIAMEMEISVGSAHTLVAEQLCCRKVCVQWIAKRLTPEIKE